MELKQSTLMNSKNDTTPMIIITDNGCVVAKLNS